MGYQSGSERKYLLKDARKHPLLLRRHHSRPEFLLKGRDQSDDRVFPLDDPGFTIPTGQVRPFDKVDRRVINDSLNRSQVAINLSRYSGRLSNWQSRIPPNPLSRPYNRSMIAPVTCSSARGISSSVTLGSRTTISS